MTREEKNNYYKEMYLGKKYLTTDGKKTFTIVEYNSYGDIIIEFDESGLRRHTKVSNILKGVKNPFEKSCFIFETPEAQYLNRIYKTNQGYSVQIIGIDTLSRVTYKFLDEYGAVGTTTIQNIKKGELRNPYHRNKCGGYLGEGPYLGKEFEWIYSIWHNLIVRATGARSLYYSNSYFYSIQLYKNCMICEEWLCYNTFADWYYKNISKLNPNYKYELDKDLLFPLYRHETNDVSLYSPRTVVLIPHELNLLIFDHYKYNENERNRNEILRLAEKFYKDNAISDKSYNAIQGLYNNGSKNYIYFDKGIDYRKNAYNINNP